MPRCNNPRRTWQYTNEFKVKAVQLSLLLRKDKCESSLKYHLDNKCKRNDTDRLFTPIFKAVINPYIDNHVDTKNWKTITENTLANKNDDMINKIFALGMMKPELFMGCTILGANIEHSLMHDYWKNNRGIEIDAHKPLNDRKRPINYVLLTI
jgi:hypothetical protein